MEATCVGEGGGIGVPRIMIDLAEARLDRAEAGAVMDWLMLTGAHEPPPWVVERAVRAAGHAAPERAPRPSGWRRLVASLVADTRLLPSAAGARDLGSGRPRLRYAAGGVEIDLELGDSSLAGRVRVFGHVAPSGSDRARAAVAMDGPSGFREAPLDDLGQFALDGLVHGAHRLEVRLPTSLIEVPELHL